MEPRISIVVPVYNVKEYLQECVESLCGQTYRELEIILVDDGSTDGSGEKCDELARQDDRIRVVHRPNGGLSAARNTGLEYVSGEYVGFVDSDDTVDAAMYRKLIDLCEHNDVPVACARFHQFGDTDQPYLYNETGETTLLSGREYLKNIITYNEAFPSSYSVWTRLYKRSLLEGIRFPEGMTYEDIIYSTKVLHKVKKMAYYNLFLYNYRVRAESISHDRAKLQKGMLGDRRIQRADQIRYLQQIGDTELANIARSVYYPELARMVENGCPEEFKEAVEATLKEWHLCAKEIWQLPFGLGHKCRLLFKMRT